MADTGWLNLSTFSSASPGGIAWSSPANAELQDGSAARATNSSTTAATTEWLTALSPASLSLPTGITINGIEVRFRRKDSSGNVSPSSDHEITLLKGGARSGEVKEHSVWPPSYAYESIGGGSDLWGLTWTENDFGAGFGFALRLSIAATPIYTNVRDVDHMQVKIYYAQSGMFLVL